MNLGLNYLGRLMTGLLDVRPHLNFGRPVDVVVELTVDHLYDGLVPACNFENIFPLLPTINGDRALFVRTTKVVRIRPA